MQFETKTSILIFNNDEGILRVIAKENSEIEIEDAKNDFETGKKLADNKIKPVYADSRNVIYHSKEVRDYYASKMMEKHISAMAIHVNSLATKIIGNFFILTNKPPYPTKLFTNENDAIEWLKTFLNKKRVDEISSSLI